MQIHRLHGLDAAFGCGKVAKLLLWPLPTHCIPLPNTLTNAHCTWHNQAVGLELVDELIHPPCARSILNVGSNPANFYPNRANCGNETTGLDKLRHGLVLVGEKQPGEHLSLLAKHMTSMLHNHGVLFSLLPTSFCKHYSLYEGSRQELRTIGTGPPASEHRREGRAELEAVQQHRAPTATRVPGRWPPTRAAPPRK